MVPFQKLVSTQQVKHEDFKQTLIKAMRDSGIECEIRNNVYHWVRLKDADICSGSVYYRKAQVHWDKRVHKSLNSMCNELSIDLAKTRTQTERDALAAKWGELSNFDVGKIHLCLPDTFHFCPFHCGRILHFAPFLHVLVQLLHHLLLILPTLFPSVTTQLEVNPKNVPLIVTQTYF